jgi:MFS transporter, putative metabolite transport protein
MCVVGGVPGLLALLGAACLVSGASNFIEVIYPSELFPTQIRATATGVVTAASRIGSAISTFLLPILLHGYGRSATMLCLAAVNVVGLFVTVTLGVETKGRPLDETAGGSTAEDRMRSPLPLAQRGIRG